MEFFAFNDVMSMISKDLFQQDLDNLKDVYGIPKHTPGIKSFYIPYLAPPTKDSKECNIDRIVEKTANQVTIREGDYEVIFKFRDGFLDGHGAIQFRGPFTIIVVNLEKGVMMEKNPGIIMAWKTYDGFVVTSRFISRDGIVKFKPFLKYGHDDWKDRMHRDVEILSHMKVTDKFDKKKDVPKAITNFISNFKKIYENPMEEDLNVLRVY